MNYSLETFKFYLFKYIIIYVKLLQKKRKKRKQKEISKILITLQLFYIKFKF